MCHRRVDADVVFLASLDLKAPSNPVTLEYPTDDPHRFYYLRCLQLHCSVKAGRTLPGRSHIPFWSITIFQIFMLIFTLSSYAMILQVNSHLHLPSLTLSNSVLDPCPGVLLRENRDLRGVFFGNLFLWTLRRILDLN